MATTINYALWSPDGSDGIDDLTGDLAAMQVSVDTAIKNTRALITAPNAASSAQRGTIYPSPVQGNRVFRTDLGWEEAYFAAYNATSNPGGADPAGWYPLSGMLPKFFASKNAGMAVSSGSWSAVQWNGAAILENRGGFTVPSGSPFNIVPQLTGYYDVTFEITWDANGSGTRGIRIETDGPAPFDRINSIERNPVQATAVTQSISATVRAGNYIRLLGYQDSGGNLNMGGAKVGITWRGPKS